MRISDEEFNEIDQALKKANVAIRDAINKIEQRDERIQSLEKQIEFLQQQNLKLIEPTRSIPQRPEGFFDRFFFGDDRGL